MKSEYIFKNKLGQGTYGEVYLGDVKTDSFILTNVAIKKIKIKKTSQDTGEDIDMVKRELEILSKLQHSMYTVRYYLAETRVENGNVYLYIVMEKLNEWRMSIPYLTLNKIKTLFINLLQGLIFIHSKGVVHADIKIENILEYDGTLIYTDFGLSCFEPKCDDFSGTIKYMDPALYITYQGMLDINYEKEKISYDSDIYSLGCVFYYIMMNEDYYDLKDAADTHEEYFELYTRKINKLEKRYLGSDNFVKKMKLDKYYTIITMINIIKEMVYPISIMGNNESLNKVKRSAKCLLEDLVRNEYGYSKYC